ncbi:hypothetical protein [Microbacterium marinilacus]|uniref:GNAT family N-acetyltransferase n=1 Tax=Microbacterium marinilacus TaxID=415209 RepID=A0ABP7B4G0_9MICO|nr:hypothetical protein [Microbacterium marinilacus]MBY0687996.1 hypothetical protein [Microbacterium marinilacus]
MSESRGSGEAVSIGPATPADLRLLADIERAADALFDTILGGICWDESPTGVQRAADGGFILTAVVAGVVIGFSHVLEPPGDPHLEQLAVHPR